MFEAIFVDTNMPDVTYDEACESSSCLGSCLLLAGIPEDALLDELEALLPQSAKQLLGVLEKQGLLSMRSMALPAPQIPAILRRPGQTAAPAGKVSIAAADCHFTTQHKIQDSLCRATMVVDQGQGSLGRRDVADCAAARGMADVMHFTAGRATLLSSARKVLSGDSDCAALRRSGTRCSTLKRTCIR